MPDGIYERPGRALLDGDRFLVVGPPAGPGGVSAVELPDGSVWEVDHTGAGTVLRPMLSDLLDIAEQFADDVDDHELAVLDTLTIDGLRSVCLRARKVGRRLDPALRTLLDRLERITPAEPGIAVHALRTDDRDLDLVESEPLAAAALAAPPPLPEPGFREIRRTDDAVVSVAVERSDTHRWVRALHRRGLVLLGQAPLRRDGLLDAADVVVPADVTDDDLEIQVLEPEELAVLVDRPADAIRRAINAGREAARSDRLGDRATAEQHWEHCATLWTAAGDDQRAEQARELADAPSVHPHRRPSVTDSIAEVLEPLS